LARFEKLRQINGKFKLTNTMAGKVPRIGGHASATIVDAVKQKR